MTPDYKDIVFCDIRRETSKFADSEHAVTPENNSCVASIEGKDIICSFNFSSSLRQNTNVQELLLDGRIYLDRTF